MPLFLSSSCQRPFPLPDNLQRQWMLVEFRNFRKAELVKHHAYLDLSAAKLSQNQYSAFMGCNKISLMAEFNRRGKVKFSKLLSTLMACSESRELEAQFAEHLPTMNQYRIEGHFLTLTAADGKMMKFVAADWD